MGGVVSGPPRPRCRFHHRSDCDQCRGTSRKVTGEEFNDGWFGTHEIRYTAYPGSHRDPRVSREDSKGAPQ